MRNAANAAATGTTPTTIPAIAPLDIPPPVFLLLEGWLSEPEVDVLLAPAAEVLLPLAEPESYAEVDTELVECDISSLVLAVV